MHIIAGEGVVDILSLAPGGHEAVAAQPGEVLRQGGLAQPDGLLELRYAPLALQKLAQDGETMRVAHRLQEFGSLSRPLLQVCYIHVC